MSKKHEKLYRVWNYIEHLPIVISMIRRFVSTSAFSSLINVPIGITSSAIGLKICVIPS